MNRFIFLLLIFLFILACKEKAEMPPLYASDGKEYTDIEDVIRHEAQSKKIRIIQLDIAQTKNKIKQYEKEELRYSYETLYKILEVNRNLNLELNNISIKYNSKDQIDTLRASNGTIYYYSKKDKKEKKKISEARNDLNKVLFSIDSLDREIGL